MNICIFGAGAIGGFAASYLSRAGHEVSLISRGANLKAFQNTGLTLQHSDQTNTVYPRATDNPIDIGAVDLVLVTVKGPALRDVGTYIQPLLGDQTQVVFAMNGIPWWYDIVMGRGQMTSTALLDVGGKLQSRVGIERVIGCVVDLSLIHI